VVVILLALFAVVGLTFVLYAESEATASRVHKEGETPRKGDVEPEQLLSYFMGQLVFDVLDQRTGTWSQNSAMRGHSMLRNALGYNNAGNSPNNQFYNGTGRIRGEALGAGLNGTLPDGTAVDDYHLINYMLFPGDPVHDPERPGWRANASAATTAYCGGFNPPYTYPDVNNMYLGAMSPKDGSILIQSFHRPYLFGRLSDPANPNWTSKAGRYLILRPRPADNTPQFPYPEDEGGDVKNLPGPGYVDENGNFHNNDSIWMDLGFPIKVAPNGRRYKSLFAPLVLDLDSRLNLNVVGNILGPNRAHVSNQGWGPWEINLERLTSNPAQLAELKKVLLFRYGSPDGVPTGPDHSIAASGASAATALPLPRFFSQADFNGWDKAGNKLTDRLQLPTGTNAFPTFGAGFGNFGVGADNELLNHPSLYNVYYPGSGDRNLDAVGDSINYLRMSNLEAILRYGDTNSPALTSNLFKLMPGALNDARIRRLITTQSMDVDQPAMMPYIWDRTQDLLTKDTGDSPHYTANPKGTPIPFPTTRGVAPGTKPPLKKSGSEFYLDWRSSMGRQGTKRNNGTGATDDDFGRLDLNRGLPSYPAANAADALIADTAGYNAATRARQLFAKDIFDRLRLFTNASDIYDKDGNLLPTSGVDAQPAPGTPEYTALRWLAQLAVNIADYIDEDDYITPFNWNPAYATDVDKGWVFGTELPRLVINEAYAEYDHRTLVPVVAAAAPMKRASRVDVGVKLYNPFMKDTVRTTDDGTARLANAKSSIYQLVLSKPLSADPTAAAGVTTDIRKPENVLGKPDGYYMTDIAGGTKAVADLGDTSNINAHIVAPVNGDATMAAGFFFVTSASKVVPAATTRKPNQELKTMSYQAERTNATTKLGPKEMPTILLRRLACPNLPNDEDAASQNFNPYITVDYMENVPVNGVDPTDARAAVESLGRKQPYAASQTSRLSPPCFVDKNSGQAAQFDWLVHLDRQITSMPEILQVSGFKPHELTQQFRLGGSATAHLAPWFDQTARIYRALDFLTIHRHGASQMGDKNSSVGVTTTREPAYDRTGGEWEVPVATRFGTTHSGTPWSILPGTRIMVNGEVVDVTSCPTPTSFVAKFVKGQVPAGARVQVATLGDRVPGRININTLFPDLDTPQGPASSVFRALCDAQAPNVFTQDEVDDIYRKIHKSRTKGPQGKPSLKDKPFLPLTTGHVDAGDKQYPDGAGIDDTLFRVDPDVPGKRLLELPNGGARGDNPYLKQQMLNKIYSHLTLKSNVFAVWVTVGFFEVDANGLLGAEMGKSEGKNVRHRMFSIVDRSYFARSYTSGSSSVSNPVTPISPSRPSGGPVVVTPTSMDNIHNGSTVTISGQAQNDRVDVDDVDAVNGEITISGNKNVHNAGFTFTFTARKQQFDPITGDPLPDPITRRPPYFLDVPITITVNSPLTDTSGPNTKLKVAPGDIAKLADIVPGGGGQKFNISSPAASESMVVTVTVVGGAKPTTFSGMFTKVYNPGPSTTITVSYTSTAVVPTNPGHQHRFNTRDRRNADIPFYSVIE